MSLENIPFDRARETLMEHGSFVHSLALKLCHDRTEADDLAQSAWVAALGSSPDPEGGLRPWFSRVLRSLRFSDRRTEVRRRDREHLSYSEEAAPDPQELAARIETQQRVVAGVLALPEPYRDALLQGFYEGQSVTAMAERAGVSVNTIKSRRARALSLLREELDRSSGGDRRAWLAALAPWIESASSTAIPLATESAIGVSTMAWMTASAVGLVLGGFGMVAWVSGDGQEGPGQPHAGLERPGTPDSGASVLDEQDPEEEEEEAAVPASILRGRIHWPEGVKVPKRGVLDIREGHPCAPDDPFSRELLVHEDGGIENVLVTVKVPDALAEVPEEPIEVTGEDGHLEPRILVLPPGGTLRLIGGPCQTCNFHGYTRRNQGFNLTVQEGQFHDVVLTRLEKFILGDDLRPWARAHVFVTADPYWAVTDSEGNFEVRGLPPGDYEVEFWHAELGRIQARVSFAEGETSEVIRSMGQGTRRR